MLTVRLVQQNPRLAQRFTPFGHTVWPIKTLKVMPEVWRKPGEGHWLSKRSYPLAAKAGNQIRALQMRPQASKPAETTSQYLSKLQQLPPGLPQSTQRRGPRVASRMRGTTSPLPEPACHSSLFNLTPINHPSFFISLRNQPSFAECKGLAGKEKLRGHLRKCPLLPRGPGKPPLHEKLSGSPRPACQVVPHEHHRLSQNVPLIPIPCVTAAIASTCWRWPSFCHLHLSERHISWVHSNPPSAVKACLITPAGTDIFLLWIPTAITARAAAAISGRTSLCCSWAAGSLWAYRHSIKR